MARLLVLSFDDQPTSGIFCGLPDQGSHQGTTTFDTSVKRAHTRASGKFVTGGTTSTFSSPSINAGYIRFYLRVTALPSGSSARLYSAGTGGGVILTLNTDGTITPHDNGVDTGPSATALTDSSKFYCIELRTVTSSGATVDQLKIDGVVQTQGVVTDPGNQNHHLGNINTGGGQYTAYASDWVSDSADWVGAGGISVLLPTADSARDTLWTGGAGGTTSLFDAVNNTPPLGTATETNLTQIEHAGTAGGTTDRYDATMETYDTWVPSGSTISGVTALLITGEDVGTGDKLLSHQILSNPAGTSTGSYNVATAGGNVALGTYPTNWFRHTVTDLSPTVTTSIAPVLRVIRPEIASRVASVCFMGIIVEWSPGNAPVADNALDLPPRAIARCVTLGDPGFNLTVRITPVVVPPVTPVDAPNPSFSVVGRQAFVARLSGSTGQFNSLLPVLAGRDQFNVGQQSFALPPYPAARARDYTLSAALFHGIEAQPVVGQSYDLPAHAPARSSDYSFTATFFHGLDGQDALPTGAQLSGNAPAATPRSRDYSFNLAFFHGLDGRDSLPTGEQLSGNAPAGPRRAVDYTAIQTPSLETLGPPQEFPSGGAAFDLPVPAPQRARDYSVTASFFHGLDGADTLASGAQSFDLPARAAARARDYSFSQAFFHGLDGQDALPVGDQSFELPAKAPARSRDYSFTASYFPGLIGQDAFPSGAQLSGNAPIGAARARDYTWLQTLDVEILGPSQQFPVGAAAYDLPIPAAARARDYSIAASFPLELIAQDAMVVGAQLSGNTPANAPRASTLGDPGVNLTILLPVALPVGQSTLTSDVPPRAALRERDYSFVAGFFHGLDGQDTVNPGAQLSGNTPPTALRASSLASDPGVNLTVGLVAAAPVIPYGLAALDQQYRPVPRAREYGLVASFFRGLDGQDQLAAGAQLSGNTPAAAARARDYTWVQSFPLTLIAQDAKTAGAALSGNAPLGPPRARDYTWLQTLDIETLGPPQQFPAGSVLFDLPVPGPLRARDYSFSGSFFHGLDAQDALNAGRQSFELPPRGQQRAATLSDPLGSVNNVVNPPPATPPVPVVQTTSTTEIPPRAAARAVDYSFTGSFFHGLDGQDAMVAGARLSGNTPAGPRRASTLGDPGSNQIPLLISTGIPFVQTTSATDNPPRGPARAREYGQTASYTLELIGQDQFPTGAPLSGNAPRGAARSADYTWTQSLALNVFQQLPSGAESFDLPPRAALRAREYGQTAAYTLELIGQDAFPTGATLSGNAPTGAKRANDYTFTASFPLELIAQDQFNPGQQLSGNAPAGALRARDYSFSQTLDIETLGPPQQFPTGNQSFDLPPRAPSRAREYGLASSFPLELIGRDAFNTGVQLSGNAPAGPLRASTLGDPGSNQLIELTAAAPQIGPGLSTALTDLPPRAALRARDYSFTESYTLELIGKDFLPVGDSTAQTELAPRGASRAKDYSFYGSYTLSLIGKDQLPTGTQLSGNAPSGPKRAVDYTFLGSFPPELIGQDQLTAGEQSFELPPRGAARSRDYTFTGSYTLELIGKDFLPVGAKLSGNTPPAALRASTLSDPGANYTANQPVFTPVFPTTAVTELPTPAPKRSKDYSFSGSFFHGLDGKDALAVGLSTDRTVLPTPAPARARDYTFLGSFFHGLDGKDFLPTGRSTAEAELPPKAPRRMVDYTFTKGLSTIQLFLITAKAPSPTADIAWINPTGRLVYQPDPYADIILTPFPTGKFT